MVKGYRVNRFVSNSNRFASRYVFPNVDGLEFPIFEEKERYGDIVYIEYSPYRTVPEHDFYLSTGALSFFWNFIHRTNQELIELLMPPHRERRVELMI